MKIAGILLLAALGLVAACTEQKSRDNSAHTGQSQTAVVGQTTGLTPKEVCMVNDTHMGKAQIPVAYRGSTYYGCCPMCVERIQKERAVRYAKDPVTGKEVDKAKAVIGLKRGSADEVLYFESEDSFRRYNNS